MATPGEMWKWRMIDTEEWEPVARNMANFGVAFGLYYAFVHYYVAEWISMLVVLFIEGIWQIKNALIPDNEVDYIGGPGFSYVSLIYDFGGILVALLIDLMWPPHIRPTGDDECNPEEEDCEFANEL